MIVHDGDDLIVRRGGSAARDEGRGAPGDEAGTGIKDLIVGDGDHLHGEEFLVRLAIPRVARRMPARPHST